MPLCPISNGFNFQRITGYEAYTETERSQPYIRDTYDVRVIIVPDGRVAKGFRVDTAFPATSNRDAMSNLKMEFYDAALGVEFSVTWKDEEEFRRAKAFLTELAGPSAGRATPDEPEYYYFETHEQCLALFRFQRELREPGPLR